MKKYLGNLNLNTWNVLIGNSKYIITPAHNVIHKKHGILTKSSFVKKCNYKWHVPTQYLSSFSPEFDIAWAQSVTNNDNCLIPTSTEHNLSLVYFYYLQPRHYSGSFSDDYQMGATQGIIYKSPNSTLHESVGIGFRGMSGAIVVSPKQSNEYVGLFLRLGKPLGLDKNASTLEMSETNHCNRGLIMTTDRIKQLIETHNTNIDEHVCK